MFPDAMSYYSMVIFVTIAAGLTFELPLLEFILIYIGVLNVKWLKNNRRTVILILIVFAAVVTPPDCITQISLATPLYLMYEIALRLGERMRKRKLAREAAEEAKEEAREKEEELQYIKEEAHRRLEEKRQEEAQGAYSPAPDAPKTSDYDDLADPAYAELDTLEDDYSLDTYMNELENSPSAQGYINYGTLAKGGADTSALSPDWSLNEPDTSLMSPDWSLNAEAQSTAGLPQETPENADNVNADDQQQGAAEEKNA